VCSVARSFRWGGSQHAGESVAEKIQEILDYKRKYLETAIRDAQAAGLVHAPDVSSKARILFAYFQGLLTEARIQNNLEVLREAERGTSEILGVKEVEAVPA